MREARLLHQLHVPLCPQTPHVGCLPYAHQVPREPHHSEDGRGPHAPAAAAAAAAAESASQGHAQKAGDDHHVAQPRGEEGVAQGPEHVEVGEERGAGVSPTAPEEEEGGRRCRRRGEQRAEREPPVRLAAEEGGVRAEEDGNGAGEGGGGGGGRAWHRWRQTEKAFTELHTAAVLQARPSTVLPTEKPLQSYRLRTHCCSPEVTCWWSRRWNVGEATSAAASFSVRPVPLL